MPLPSEFGSDRLTLEVGRYLRDVVENMTVEIEQAAEEKVAAVLRERGWVCVSPYKGAGGA